MGMQVSTAAAHVIRVMSAEEQTSLQLVSTRESLVPELVRVALSKVPVAQTYALEALVNLAQVLSHSSLPLLLESVDYRSTEVVLPCSYLGN